MASNKLTNEDRIIDLLEKNLIIQLYFNGATRNQITEILKIGSVKVSNIIKHLKRRQHNE